MRSPLMLAPLLAVACGAPIDEAELGQSASEVHAARKGTQYAYDKLRDQASRATGAVHVPIPGYGPVDGAPVRGTCGVTFVSPHYAITAAHCVSSTKVSSPATTDLVVEAYDVATVSDSRLAVAEAVSGTFPRYTRSALTTSDGYAVTRYPTCRVVSRCQRPTPPSGEAWGNFNCPPGAANDVALLRCGTRPSGASFVPAALTDSESGAVDMRWAHEVLAIPTTMTVPRSDMDRHYTLQATYDTNFHYLGGTKNQLLPLRSLDWPSGPRTRRPYDAYEVNTDLYGCHGTSGSGVLQKTAGGGFELLGPVQHGGSLYSPTGEPLLCMTDLSAGGWGVRYTKLANVRAMESIARNDLAEKPVFSTMVWSFAADIRGAQKIAVCQDGALYAYYSDGRVQVNRSGGSGTWSLARTIETGVRSLTCGSGDLYYLTSDSHLKRIPGGTGAPQAVGYPWAAVDVASSEDQFPFMWALNYDNSLYYSGSWGTDGSFSYVQTLPVGGHIAATHSMLLHLGGDGSLRVARTATRPLTFRTLPSVYYTIDIAAAAVGEANADAYVYRLDQFGNLYRGAAQMTYLP